MGNESVFILVERVFITQNGFERYVSKVIFTTKRINNDSVFFRRTLSTAPGLVLGVERVFRTLVNKINTVVDVARFQ